MSKKYKGRICVYCGVNKSTCPDHVIAREFFEVSRRHNLPKVPSCEECNNIKSQLEHYFTSLLPFGSDDDSAREIFQSSVEKRLNSNLKLKRHLSDNLERRWTKTNNNIYLQTVQLPINPVMLLSLFNFIIKGLLWHHWKVTLSSDYFVKAITITDYGVDNFYKQLFRGAVTGVVDENLADNGFTYIGRQGTEYPQMSVWLMKIYNGITLAGINEDEGQSSRCIFGMTGHRRILRNAFLRRKYGI